MVALLLLLVGVSILSLQDSLVKLIAPQTSFWQVQVIRSGFNLTILAGLAIFTGGIGLLWPRRLGPALETIDQPETGSRAQARQSGSIHNAPGRADGTRCKAS